MSKYHGTRDLEFDQILHESDDAWLLLMEWVDDSFKIWFPKSECSIEDEIITVPAWLLERKSKEHEVQEFEDILRGVS